MKINDSSDNLSPAFGANLRHRVRTKRGGGGKTGESVSPPFRRPRLPQSRSLEERVGLLIEHYDVAPNGCWEWRGSLNENGYAHAMVMIDGRKVTVRIHRLAYMGEYGEIPKGMQICHRCDNRRCINPAHLFAGTAKDNWQDMYNKGRHWSQRRKARKDALDK